MNRRFGKIAWIATYFTALLYLNTLLIGCAGSKDSLGTSTTTGTSDDLSNLTTGTSDDLLTTTGTGTGSGTGTGTGTGTADAVDGGDDVFDNSLTPADLAGANTSLTNPSSYEAMCLGSDEAIFGGSTSRYPQCFDQGWSQDQLLGFSTQLYNGWGDCAERVMKYAYEDHSQNIEDEYRNITIYAIKCFRGGNDDIWSAAQFSSGLNGSRSYTNSNFAAWLVVLLGLK